MKIGSLVSWKSQSQGAWKKKEGRITYIVPAGEMPPVVIRGAWDPATGKAQCFRRNHESYVVTVGKRDYWPRVSALNESPDPEEVS